MAFFITQVLYGGQKYHPVNINYFEVESQGIRLKIFIYNCEIVIRIEIKKTRDLSLWASKFQSLKYS